MERQRTVMFVYKRGDLVVRTGLRECPWDLLDLPGHLAARQAGTLASSFPIISQESTRPLQRDRLLCPSLSVQVILKGR